METAMVRWVRGGELDDGKAIVQGPAFKRGYSTPANGWADDIQVNDGEIAVRVIRGGLYTFSGYLIGNREAVKCCLKAALDGADIPPTEFKGSWTDLKQASAYGADAALALGIEVR